MGIMKKFTADVGEIRCRYRAEVPFVCRKIDVHSWTDYIIKQLPSSYEGEVAATIGEDVVQMYLRYEASSANSHDIVRRLRSADLYFVPQPGSRVKLCGCPSGTTQCYGRSGGDK